MNLLPQDVLVAMKLAVMDDPDWTYGRLAKSLGMPASAAFQAFKRACRAGLCRENGRTAIGANLIEFLIHGGKYAFPAEIGTVTRGMVTGWASRWFDGVFPTPPSPDGVPVWPCPEGTTRGVAMAPLCRCVPVAAAADDRLYRLLALFDAVRAGRAREKSFAIKEIEEIIEERSGIPDKGK